MSEFTVFLFCAAVGFAVAGAVSSFYQLVTSETPDLLKVRDGVSGAVVAALVGLFGGPFIVARKVVIGLRARELTLVPALMGLAAVGMWSTIAGIFYVSLVLLI